MAYLWAKIGFTLAIFAKCQKWHFATVKKIKKGLLLYQSIQLTLWSWWSHGTIFSPLSPVSGRARKTCFAIDTVFAVSTGTTFIAVSTRGARVTRESGGTLKAWLTD